MTGNIPETIDGLQTFRFTAEANAYYKTAIGGINRKNIFTNEILYNIISMSIEKYIMAFLTARKELPPCHTLGAMIMEVKKFIPVDESIVKKMKHLDKLQFICSMTYFKPEPISDPAIEDMIIVLTQIRELVLANPV